MKTVWLQLAATASALTMITPVEARPFLPEMSCAAARSLVAANGQIVLSTSQSTYDRFVVDRSFCGFDEYTGPGIAQTRDAPDCVIGFICKEYTSYPRKGR